MCDLSFTNTSQRQQHMQVHANYKCPNCDKLFPSRVSLIKHVQKKHVVENLCQICAETFTFKANFAKHLKTQEKDNFYSCLPCGKFFPSYCSLTVHNKTHGDGEEDSITIEWPHWQKCEEKYGFFFKMFSKWEYFCQNGQILCPFWQKYSHFRTAWINTW